MILNKRNKKHCEAIVKHCTDNGMTVESTMGLWNHLVRMFKRIEILEQRSAELKERVRTSPNKQIATVLDAELRKFCDPDNPMYTLRTHIPQLAAHLNSALKAITKA